MACWREEGGGRARTWSFVSPWPRLPKLPSPHVYTSPWSSTTTVWSAPHATCLMWTVSGKYALSENARTKHGRLGFLGAQARGERQRQRSARGRASGRRPRTHLGRTVASPSSFSMPHVSVWPRRPWRRGGWSETASVRPPSWPHLGLHAPRVQVAVGSHRGAVEAPHRDLDNTLSLKGRSARTGRRHGVWRGGPELLPRSPPAHAP